MATLKRFRYDALSGATSSRLIKLLPALRQESTIRIELSEFHFGSTVEYEALSYTWDDQRPTKEVICNGKVLMVTENVFLALQRLRSNRAKHRIIWIDAICINQKDDAEKATQVTNMGSIYAHAAQVNIWLSRPTPAMKLAFNYIRLTTGPEVQFPHIPNSQVPEIRDGFYQLCSHPYWTRIWTVQEVALNEKCQVYLGKLEPMDMLSFGVMLYEVEGYLNLRSEQAVPRVSENFYPVSFQRGSPSLATRMHRTRGKDMRIGDALSHLMMKKAKNPLDLVFACRALFPDSFGQIEVDYSRDLSDVLREVTAHIIPRLRKPADLFHLVCHCPPVTNAPSWTLNLQCDIQLHTATHYSGMWLTVDHESPNTAHVLPDRKTLCVDGNIVDEIALVSDEFPLYTPQSQEKWHRDVRTLLKNWRAYTNDHLGHGFEEAMHYILYVSTNSAENLAAEIAETVRFEPAQVIDEDGTPLSNTVYTIRQVGDSDDLGHLSSTERDKKRQMRVSAFREWLDDSDAPIFRLDVEEILHSTYAEDYLSATHAPALSTRILFTTASGRMGLGKSVQPGDAIALTSGCQLPFVLRAAAETGGYTLVQPAILEGVMQPDERQAIIETGWGTIKIV